VELKKLSPSFYTDNVRVEQALDFDMKAGCWLDIDNKVRGHGVVKITIQGLMFAIPVRSHIRHEASFILQVDRKNRHIKGMGLDYSKALLIRDERHVADDVFVLRSKAAGRKLVDKEEHITKQFTGYVEKYISSVQKNDRNVLNSFEYRYTTLINYHTELGIK